VTGMYPSHFMRLSFPIVSQTDIYAFFVLSAIVNDQTLTQRIEKLNSGGLFCGER
jgi:hypothetical protein